MINSKTMLAALDAYDDVAQANEKRIKKVGRNILDCFNANPNFNDAMRAVGVPPVGFTGDKFLDDYRDGAFSYGQVITIKPILFGVAFIIKDYLHLWDTMTLTVEDANIVVTLPTNRSITLKSDDDVDEVCEGFFADMVELFTYPVDNNNKTENRIGFGFFDLKSNQK